MVEVSRTHRWILRSNLLERLIEALFGDICPTYTSADFLRLFMNQSLLPWVDGVKREIDGCLVSHLSFLGWRATRAKTGLGLT